MTAFTLLSTLAKVDLQHKYYFNVKKNEENERISTLALGDKIPTDKGQCKFFCNFRFTVNSPNTTLYLLPKSIVGINSFKNVFEFHHAKNERTTQKMKVFGCAIFSRCHPPSLRSSWTNWKIEWNKKQFSDTLNVKWVWRVSSFEKCDESWWNVMKLESHLSQSKINCVQTLKKQLFHFYGCQEEWQLLKFDEIDNIIFRSNRTGVHHTNYDALASLQISNRCEPRRNFHSS